MFNQGTILPSAARTAAPTPVVIPLVDFENLSLLINVTAVSGTISLGFILQEMDDAGNWVTVLATSAITTATQARLSIGSHIIGAANAAFQMVLPSQLRLLVTHSTADSTTYNVTYRAR